MNAYKIGMIGVWSASEGVLREGNIHPSQVVLLSWNALGTRLITSDKDGQTVLWKVDARGRLTILFQYRLSNVIKTCLHSLSYISNFRD